MSLQEAILYAVADPETTAPVPSRPSCHDDGDGRRERPAPQPGAASRVLVHA
jgi:hypothetical protein